MFMCVSKYDRCMSIHPNTVSVHFLLQRCLSCHCNVCDIKWTKLKLQVCSSTRLFCGLTWTHIWCIAQTAVTKYEPVCWIQICSFWFLLVLYFCAFWESVMCSPATLMIIFPLWAYIISFYNTKAGDVTPDQPSYSTIRQWHGKRILRD